MAMSRIETARLRLRPYDPGDLEHAVGLYGDPEVTRFTKLGRLDRAQAEAIFAEHLALWESEGLGLYALTLKDSGAFVGECGFFRVPERPEPYLRYALLRTHWGQGLAREAAVAVLEEAFGPRALGRVMSVVEARNGASQRIMELLGFRLDHDRLTPKGRIFVYALTAEHWAAGSAAPAG